MFNPSSTPCDAFAPLSLSKFTSYILVPYIGHRLIAGDLNCGSTAAYQEMVDSGDTGANLQPAEDDDQEIDELVRANNRKARLRREQQAREGLMTREEILAIKVCNCRL